MQRQAREWAIEDAHTQLIELRQKRRREREEARLEKERMEQVI